MAAASNTTASNVSSWAPAAQLAYQLAIQHGLTPAEATDFAAVQYGESGFNPNAQNKSSGAAGLYQLLSSGYVNRANQMGGVFNPTANILAILPNYVSYYRSHPQLVPGAAGAAVEASGEPASYYAAGYAHLGDTGVPLPAGSTTEPGPAEPVPANAPGAPTDALAQLLLQNGGLFPQAKTVKAGFKNPVVKLNTKPPADLTNALTVARKYLDQSKGTFSNAGFAQYVHSLRGVKLPGTARGQLKATSPTRSPKAGDLVFGKGGQHLGVLIDHQTYLGASRGGKQLNVSGLADQPTAGLATVRTVDGANPIA